MKSAFDKIAAGLDDAIAHANGETGRGKVAVPVRVLLSLIGAAPDTIEELVQRV